MVQSTNDYYATDRAKDLEWDAEIAKRKDLQALLGKTMTLQPKPADALTEKKE